MFLLLRFLKSHLLQPSAIYPLSLSTNGESCANTLPFFLLSISCTQHSPLPDYSPAPSTEYLASQNDTVCSPTATTTPSSGDTSGSFPNSPVLFKLEDTSALHRCARSPHWLSKILVADDDVAEKLGFEKVSEEFIAECKSRAILYKHKKTGAEIM
ncbi:hypothetical protein OROGR_009964 [Orobanche gracilis]